MKPTDNNKDKGQGQFQGQQNQNQGQAGQRANWQEGQKEVKERKPGEPDQNPQGSHRQKGVGGKILGQEEQFKAGHAGQNPQGNFQPSQSRFQGDQGKMKNENRDADKDSVSE